MILHFKKLNGIKFVFVSKSNINLNQTIMNRTLGIILCIVGVAMLIWGGFSYTKKEKVIDAGPIQISADKKESVNWPPFAGGAVLVVGLVILGTASKGK